MYEWITIIITIIAPIVTAVSTAITAICVAITARIQKRASRKQSVIEVLNDVVIPLLNKIEIYERSKCQEGGISTLPINVEHHTKSDIILYKRFIELFKKYHDYEEFQRGIDEFNCVQLALEKKVNTLRSTLANILQGDKRI
jgi:ribosomal protein S17